MKKSIFTFLLFFSFASFLLGQNSPPKKSVLDSIFYSVLPEHGPGLALKIDFEQEEYYHNEAGKANLSYDLDLNDSSRFLVASIAKQFTAYALVLLEEEGKLDLDEPISRLLPELSHFPNISIRNLANHTSGFRNTFDLNNLQGRSDADLITQDETLDLLFRQKGLNFEPGERFQYCNSGYVLLAEIVSRASELSFAQFVQDHIFKPADMTHSLILDQAGTIIPYHVTSYWLLDSTYEEVLFQRAIYGSTGLYTSSRDLLKWSRFLSKQDLRLQKMIRPSQLNSRATIPYGLGLETKIYRGHKIIFHGGGDAGYRAYFLKVPDLGLSIITMGNFLNFNPLDIVYPILDLFIGIPALKVPVKFTTKLEKYTGTYQIFPGLFIDILSKDQQLYFRSFGTSDSLPLPRIGENVFSFPYRTHSKFVFTDHQVSWHFSDFSYPGKKVNQSFSLEELPDPEDYIGQYYSEELKCLYVVSQTDSGLVIKGAIKHVENLNAIASDSFITNSNPIGRLDFIRENGIITGCNISSQNAYDIYFTKIN
jgi:CubicO group peptidase (beta-lactamase class C family)